MTRKTAVFGSFLFFLIAPGTVAGIVPWWISRGHAEPAFFGIEPLRWLGAALTAAGLPVLIASFARFALDGLGTPAPVAPPRHLVVRGAYRYVRNPMYVALLAIIFGQAILLANGLVVLYGAAFWLACHLFVVLYEEPDLQRRFGDDYRRLRAAVPRWLPRLIPWSPPADQGSQPMTRLILMFCLALAAATAVQAQSLDELDKRQAAMIEAWQKTPLTIRRALFIDGEARGFGLYQERGSKEFKRGEKVVVYAEPVGYGWKDAGKGMFELGFVVDFLIKSRNGEILAGKENFMRIATESHTRNLEFMVVLTLNLSSAPSGEYVVEYKLHDIASDKTVTFEMPFKLAS